MTHYGRRLPDTNNVIGLRIRVGMSAHSLPPGTARGPREGKGDPVVRGPRRLQVGGHSGDGPCERAREEELVYHSA